MPTINPFAGPATEIRKGDEVKIIPPKSIAEAQQKAQNLETENADLKSKVTQLEKQVEDLRNPPKP